LKEVRTKVNFYFLQVFRPASSSINFRAYLNLFIGTQIEFSFRLTFSEQGRSQPNTAGGAKKILSEAKYLSSFFPNFDDN